ncbi:MAG: ornithine carbamoyltransferase [Candidatus Odinarchaeum yellowstonii]|jgi:ornithine carbamoyltransferase|uniref:Ornithine carbamoyltransferase n=1 Tax=Odinarchaeota yellowstonii (strain LCB_4) TaxID=1841599 RepID=A0AAF0IBV9_ODILC|nr:MAG: ornithine carbamoyltransferase [Candidatus Odinarchaeum yellowstonii]
MNLKGRHLLSLKDFTKEEILKIIENSIKEKYQIEDILKGKTIGLLFQKPSTRTRISFEVAVNQLGGRSIYMNWSELQLSRKESLKDTALVFSRYLNALVARLFKHEDLLEIAEYSTIPVINGLTDLEHPCQILGDLQTIIEKKGDLKEQKIVFIGDGNNVSNSLLIASSILGLKTSLICPKGYEPPESILRIVKNNARTSNAKITVTNDLSEAEGATVIYTDVWVSMGQEEETTKRLRDFADYKVTESVVRKATPDYIFMHCLPRTVYEVSDEVFYGKHSVVWDQAENRLHIQKAILKLLV